ncbi:hypothetical protein ACF0H5_021247 [Mactra antiquata]
MSQNEDKFEEEFSNWAKTVLGLQNARDDSIEHIKYTMKSFADKSIHQHVSDGEEHFKDLLIKVAVDGDVKKIHKDKKDPTTVRWLLDNNNCSTCDEIFEEIQDNFTERRCICKNWISNSEKEQIISSSYWWVLAKIYTINPEVKYVEGPKDVEPLAVFNLLKRCGLFVDKIRIHADNLVKLRHNLMHSSSNRLTDIEMRESFHLIKDFIKLVLDKPDEAINDLEKIETSTVVLFDENGEYGELAKKALQEQEGSLNADFKSPEGIRVAIKSIAASNIELKELESKIEESEKEANRYKLDDLKSRLHKETERNNDNENQFKEINTKLEKQVTEMTQERNKQREEIFLLKKAIKTHPVYQVKSYKDIDVRVDSDKAGCFIKDMCQMSDGAVVINDSHNKKLLRLGDDYNLKDFYDLNDEPVSVVPVSSSELAVLVDSWKIEFIKVSEHFKHKKLIKLEGVPSLCRSMIYCNDKIWIHCENGIYVYSLSGSLMKHIQDDSRGQRYSMQFKFSNAIYNTISTNKDNTKVFVLYGNFVDVLNTDGEVLSTFPIHDECCCMTITRDNVMLTLSHNSRNVTMYDIEGNNLGDLITENNSLPLPISSLLYDRNKDCLIVGYVYLNLIGKFKLDKFVVRYNHRLDLPT